MSAYRTKTERGAWLLEPLLVLVALSLFPTDAEAWGPVAHLDFSMQLLTGAAAIAPAVRRLIERFPRDFLYGSLAADAVVGKNRAGDRDHCHAWSVARPLLQRAKRECPEREALMLGYLGHLGADVVAHNHIVPKMLITHFRAKGVGHLYWEARADQKLLSINPKLKSTWAELAGQRFPAHDAFLAEQLVSPLLPHALSKQLYRRGLGVQRRSPWQRAMRRIESRSRLGFSAREIDIWRTLAVEANRLAIDRPLSRRLDQLDPTGRPTLDRAKRHRRALRRQLRERGEGHALNELLRHTLADIQTVDIGLFSP